MRAPCPGEWLGMLPEPVAAGAADGYQHRSHWMTELTLDHASSDPTDDATTEQSSR